VEVIFFNAVEYCLQFPLDVRHCFKHRPFSFVSNLGNKAKSQGTKSGKLGGWGMITILLLVTKSVVFRDVWAGALSWWRSQLWLCQSSGLFRCAFSLKRLETSQYKSELTVVLWGTNSRWTIPFTSN
jgi:hypothetical protein